MKSTLAPLLMLLLFLAGCKTNTVEPDPDALGHRFFPLEVKSFRIYQVNETRYLNDQATTTSYQVRERVEAVVTDLANEETFHIIRSRRESPSQPWADDSVIVVRRSVSDLRVTRHNVKVVQLIFPVRNGKSWNANAFNHSGQNEFTYQAVGLPYTVDNQTYDKTVTVIQGDVSNLIELDERKEVYAEDIGLIYKEYTRLNYCDDPSKCSFNRQPTPYIQEGVRRVDKLISFGTMP
jgi:hypothetical protein